jgi:hypothetical protein
MIEENKLVAEHKGPAIAYIREVRVVDLPEDVQEQAEGMDTLFAVSNEDGEPLALVHNRKLAFMLARENDFSPMSVH